MKTTTKYQNNVFNINSYNDYFNYKNSYKNPDNVTLIKLSNKAEYGDLKENCAPLEALIGKAAGLLTTVIHNVSDADLRELREEESRLKKINEEGLETQKLLDSKE